MYVTQALHRMVQRAAYGPALIDGNLRLNWIELQNRVARFAGSLQALGVKPGDRVSMLARNGAHYVEYMLGTLWAGGVINPVNVRWTADEIGWSLADCDTQVLLIAPEFEPLLPKIRALAPGLRQVLSLGHSSDNLVSPRRTWSKAGRPVGDALRRDDDLAAILYTGGTTGRPKGVMLSHANLVSSALGNLIQPGCRPHSSFLHSAPLFHIGAISGMMIALFAGVTSVMLPGFEPRAVLETVARHRVTDLFMVPSMLRMLLDHPRFAEFDNSSLRAIRYGAAPIENALLDQLVAAFPKTSLIQAYGMTELAPTCTLLGPEDHTAEAREQGRGRSVGRATAVCEVRIVDSTDEELPRGNVGEIVVRGPTVMVGYWNLPAETENVLRGGWMHTGDLGWMDQAGYVTLADRLKDMIITGGENVYCAEVENAISAHPSVAEVAVIGLPDKRWGERVHAVIVLRRGAVADAASIDRHCRSLLAGYKIPRSVQFVEALPLSAAGKVLKTELRKGIA